MALRTLYQTLMDSDLARLRVIAQQWDLELIAERRADMAAELAEAMARADVVERVLEVLEPEPKAALEDLLRHDGAMPWAAFTRRWGRIRMVGPGRLEREALWQTPISPAESLWYWGLLQRAPAIDATGASVEMAFVPESLLLYLPTPPELEIPLPKTTAPPLHVVTGDDHLCDDLVTLFAYVQNHNVRSDAAGTWPHRHLEALKRQLQTPAAWQLLQTVALEQGWLERNDQDEIQPVPQPMLTWLHSDRLEQWKALAQGWMDSQNWNDLVLVPALQPDPALGWPNNPLLTRRNVIELLERCTPGVWYPLAGFIAHVREHSPDFMRPNADYDAWSLRDALTEAPLRGFEAWDAVEGALLGTLLIQSLAWVGIVELGKANPILSPNSFRLSEMGAALLDLGEPPILSKPPMVELQNTGIIVVPAGSHYEHFQLSRIAEAVTATPTSYRYRLTPTSLARARRQHIPLRRIVEFLSEATGQALPAALRKAIERAYRQSGQVRLTQTWVLRAKDPDLLDYEEVRDLLQERLGPRVALVRATDIERLSNILIQAGLLADVEAFVES